jgi:thiol:disulfide interchange protein DsbG
MRRFYSLFVAFSAVLALSACNDSVAPSAPPAATAPLVQSDVFTQVAGADGFDTGAGPTASSMPIAYVLFDPQCPHCAHLWEAARPLQSQVHIKWVPVALLNGTSATQAAMLLEVPDPIALMNANEATILRTGLPSTDTAAVKDASRRLVEGNTALLRTLGATSVPTLIYQDPVSKASTMVSGSMSTEKLAKLLGVSPAAAAVAATVTATATDAK